MLLWSPAQWNAPIHISLIVNYASFYFSHCEYIYQVTSLSIWMATSNYPMVFFRDTTILMMDSGKSIVSTLFNDYFYQISC